MGVPANNQARTDYVVHNQSTLDRFYHLSISCSFGKRILIEVDLSDRPSRSTKGLPFRIERCQGESFVDFLHFLDPAAEQKKSAGKGPLQCYSILYISVYM